MDLSPIQNDILITLISLYEKKSLPIKGEEIADIILRNPGTVRNQMQALKAIGLVDGIPGPKGGYHPTSLAYKELNLKHDGETYEVKISRDGEIVPGVKVGEIIFTTLSHADICHAQIRIIGSVKLFNNGDVITIGPTPVNKLLIKGEVFGKDENEPALIVSILEMVSLPKKPIRDYMSTPIKMLSTKNTLKEAIRLFNTHHIHGAPVMDGGFLRGIVTMSDILHAIEQDLPLDTQVCEVMTEDVVYADASVQLYEVIRKFKERSIGRLVVFEDNRPVGILTQSDIFRTLPTN
ncbi:MAG TPA: CBS domain-containing protein [Methanospirillum sp.]|uniref:CBS domain-containing protein n=1 Tax=Methanospirillum sp. TaxID=45200 RepID=UPI002B5155DD|nr:CBS domain-containing protein [Methanospirillum sp.]HOJ96682.1 CBS domain-containing protein [Methanospirillum sp.]HOL41006.1 CBS domain-containing protein [Methanospirillum sp.]HPP78167.1 CBS domain-containing protein [Methanospirillum sp.]